MPAWIPRAVPLIRLGKKYPVDGMYPEKAPPPMPVRKEKAIRTQTGVLGSRTAHTHPSIGISMRSDVYPTSLRVPRIGGRNM